MKRKQQSNLPSEPAASTRQRWFRLATLLLPIVLLGLCEVLLRLFGYGYSPHFFLPATINGQRVFIENQKFSRRYFPPALARTPQPVVFAAKKPADTIRILVFGESAAMGDPEPAFGLPRVLEVLLQERNSGKKVEVINVAVTAINSHVIREIARDCAPMQGDIWIIYMGNNEVVGPYGAGTVFGAQTPKLGVIRASIAIKTIRIGQLLDALQMRLGGTQPASWEGMEMFLKQQVAQNDPRLATVYKHFERNLTDIVKIGQRAGARVVVSTVASNLKDCPPFASLHSMNLSEAKRKEWDDLYRAGTELEARTNFSGALELLQKVAAIDASHAELQFRLARCQLALANFDRARESFTKSRDLDTLRFRADSGENEIIRNVATNTSGVTFVDAVDLFATNSPNGLAGEQLLLEHVHFTFAGNYLLARSTAESVENLLLRSPSPSPEVRPWLSAEDCAARLALTDWDRLQLAEEIIRRLGQPPFTHQIDNAKRIARWEKLRTASQGEAVSASIENYRRAIEKRPNDWVLHENFAKFLQSTGDPVEAERHWRKVLELLPHSEQALYSLGNVLDAQGKSAEALSYFYQALRRRPSSYEARNGLGLALSSQGKMDDAIKNYREALRHKPDFSEARVNLGQALSQLGHDDEAIAEYRAALRNNSNSVAAHINLGRALSKGNQSAEARAEYEKALALEPNNAVAHYNLANLLASQNSPDALAHFEAAVRANPQFAEARYNLGLGFAAQNRTADAVGQFKEVVRLRPEFLDAHLNLGVALAKQRQFAEAATEFEAVLRLDPANPTAKKYLDQTRALQRNNAP